jgi:hypothetical protein
LFLVLQEKLKEEPKKQKYKKKDTVSNIYTIIMMLKIKTWVRNWKPHITWKKTGMRGRPQACGFASSCIIILHHHVMFHSKQKKYFHLHDSFWFLQKGLVLQTNYNYNFTQDAIPKIIRKSPYSTTNKH